MEGEGRGSEKEKSPGGSESGRKRDMKPLHISSMVGWYGTGGWVMECNDEQNQNTQFFQ